MVDLVPRYPAIDNEIDERAVNLDRYAPIRRQLAENIGAQRPPQIHRRGVRAPINCTSWRKISERSRAVKSTGAVFERQLTAPAAAAAAAGGRSRRDYDARQLQGDHETRARIDIISCFQWAKDRITRLGSPRYRVNPPSFNPNRPESADRAPRADLRGLGPCF